MTGTITPDVAGGPSVAVMQPYFFPYPGYFQLIHAVDTFVFLDDVDFTSRGWINRNAILLQGQRYRFTVPVRHPRWGRKICDVRVAEGGRWQRKLEATLDHAYHDAPFYALVRPLVTSVLMDAGGKSIGELASRSVRAVCDFLGIHTRIVDSAAKYGNRHLAPADRLVAICRSEGGTAVVNAPGGHSLYRKEEFRKMGVDLFFLHSRPVPSPQTCTTAFRPDLSVIDLLMSSGAEEARRLLTEYDLR